MHFPFLRFLLASVTVLLCICLTPRLQGEDPTERVTEFLSDYEGKLKDSSDVESMKASLRALVGRIENSLGARVGELDRRQAAIQEAREQLVSGLAAELVGTEGLKDAEAAENRARELVDEATRTQHQWRADYLIAHLMCWCPHCNWTKTVTGCASSCSDEQKYLVREWLGAGLSDEEIFDRMVDHPKGGPRVRTLPGDLGFSGFLLPLMIGAIALIGVVVLIRRVVRKERKLPASAPDPRESPHEARWGDEIERELEGMEN